MKDKLLIDSKINMNTFEKRPLDYTRSTADHICFDHMLNSDLYIVRGNILQGHLNPIHTEHEGVQSMRAILQTSLRSKSDNVERQLEAGNNSSCSLHQLTGLSCGKHLKLYCHILSG